MNRQLFLLLFFTLLKFGEGIVIPHFIYNGITTMITNAFGERAEKTAFKAQEYLDKKSGVDMSLGNIAEMSVEMVKVLEPYEKYVIISSYVNNRLVYLKDIISAMFKTKKTTQKELNEMIGLAIILNETEASAAEVLLSTPQCWLSSDDFYFPKSVDPCRDLSRDAFFKIISRIESVMDTLKSQKSMLEVPIAWDTHLRHVITKLDMFSVDVLEEKDRKKWSSIKEYIQSKQLL